MVGLKYQFVSLRHQNPNNLFPFLINLWRVLVQQFLKLFNWNIFIFLLCLLVLMSWIPEYFPPFPFFRFYLDFLLRVLGNLFIILFLTLLLCFWWTANFLDCFLTLFPFENAAEHIARFNNINFLFWYLFTMKGLIIAKHCSDMLLEIL